MVVVWLGLQHLQSDQHRMFVLDSSNYSAVDQLVVEMIPGFNPDPSQLTEELLNRWVLNYTQNFHIAQNHSDELQLNF